MNKNVKKILGLLLSVAMLSSVLPMSVMAGSEYKDFNDDGYIWLEETDYADRNAYSNLISGADIFSGGGARALGLNAAPDGNGYYMEYNINVPKTDDYRIWTHGQYSGSEWCSPAKVVIDETTSIDFTAEKVTTWNAKEACGLDYAIAYQYADVNLTAGEHTIRYVIDTVAPRNASWYLGVLDFMLIMPESYTWEISTTARPVAPVPTPTPTPEAEYKEFNADGYLWLEETDYYDRNAYSNYLQGIDIFSGGGVRALGITTVPDENGWYMEYKVNVPKTDSYRVWVHGGRAQGVDWASPVKLVIDGATPLSFTEDTVTTWSAKDYGLSYAIMYSYVDVNLTQGQHTIRYMVNETAPRNTSYYISALDFMLIMPTSYTWTPSITEKPIAPEVESEYKDFNADGYIWLEETDYFDRNAYSNHVQNVDIFSGGGARALGVTAAPDENGYYMEYKVNVPKTDDYKIWVHGGMSGNEWCSPSKVVIDGTTTVDFIAEKVTTWSAKDYGLSYAIAYQYVDVNLTQGEHIIRYVVDEVAPRNTSYYIGALDFMLIMPANYMWEISITDKPVAPTPEDEYEYKEFNADGYLWLEETDYADRNAYSNHVKDVEIFSGGGARALGVTTAPDENGWYMDYRVNVPKTDDYKIWVHGGMADSDWTSPAKIVIDGVTYDCIDDTVTTWSASDYGLKYGISYQYVYAKLTEGKHTIRYVIDDVAPRNTSYYLGALDFMLIMPTRCTWTPSLTERPVKPEFYLDGELTVGASTVNGTVYFDRNETEKNVTIITALYNEEGQVKQTATDTKSFTQQDKSYDINMALTSAVEAGDTFSVFIWDSLTGLKPQYPKLTLGDQFILKSFSGDVCFHTDDMESYLNDSYDSIANYADGSVRADNSLPVTIDWTWVGKAAPPVEYTLSVSENADMEDAWEFTTTANFYDVYNLKVNTRYYYTVSGIDGNGDFVVSGVKTLKTEDEAPRNLCIEGGFNSRDVGGWYTEDGSQVKQGYLYRTGRLNYISSTDEGDVLENQLTDNGIDTMVNQLGIKTEIELRQESEMPLEYTESVLGENVSYIRAPMNYDDDYLSANKESIKIVFETFADPANYPIVYHCSAGADRTGAITYMLNGLLGVSQEDLFRDYLITNFASQGARTLSQIENLYVKTLDEYHGDTLSEKIYNYLNEVIGVSTEDLDFIIEYLK